MAREQGKATNGSPEGKLEGNDYALLRRAVLSALAGAPVILTVSSSLAQADSTAISTTFEYLCNQPDLTPEEQALCDEISETN